MDQPEKLATALTELRDHLRRDPYFATAESFKPERKKTALLLHAKDDLPEVRVKVFDLLRSFGSAIRFRARAIPSSDINMFRILSRIRV